MNELTRKHVLETLKKIQRNIEFLQSVAGNAPDIDYMHNTLNRVERENRENLALLKIAIESE
jgi:hypothetical protein